MNPKKRYVLQDFIQHAHKQFPREFASVMDRARYEFNQKTFLDVNNAAHEVIMLFVGHYHIRRNGPSVWACATGSAIQYYQGPRSEDACTLIPEDQSARVYYDVPYSAMAGSQEGKGMTVGRKAGQIVVETFINFLFLSTGYLKVVNNVGRSDMLTNFKYACLKMQSAHNDSEMSKLPREQRLEAAESSADLRASKKRKGEVQEEASSSRVKNEVDDDEVLFIKTDPMSCAIKEQPRTTFTCKMNPNGNRQTRNEKEITLLAQVQALQEKLDKQMLKLQAAEKKTTHDNERRRAAEKKANNLEHKLREETRANGYLKTQLEESRKQTADWKAQHALQCEKALAWKTGAVNWKKVVDNLRAEASTPRKH